MVGIIRNFKVIGTTQSPGPVEDINLIDAPASGGDGLTAAQTVKLDGIADGAEVNPPVISQVDAEAGTAVDERTWTAQRVAQAIAALESATGGLTLLFYDGDEKIVTAATETDAHSYTMPAAELGTDESVQIEVRGEVRTTSGENGTAKLYFGATAIAIYDLDTGPGPLSFSFNATVTHRGATAQTARAIEVSTQPAGGDVFVRSASPAETVSGTIEIKVTGNNSLVGASRDVTVDFLKVTKLA